MSVLSVLKNLARARGRAEFIDAVGARAYMNEGGQVTIIDPKAVQSVARSMEAMLVMAADMPSEASIVISCTKRELNSFVCYMRELDSQYRLLDARAEKAERELEKAKEAQTRSAALNASDARRAEAKSYADRPSRKLVDVPARHVPVVKSSGNKQRGGPFNRARRRGK